MIIIYNIIQLFVAPLLLLFSPCFFLFRPEKSRTIVKRLSLGIPDISLQKQCKQIIWIHALSVGEVNSAVPLIRALRISRPDTCIVFSVTTLSGHTLAEKKVSPYVDLIIHSPLDFLPVVLRYVSKIKPDLFLLVETDFWPNILHVLASRKIPVVLVNGRISEKSMHSYRKFSFFFRPMFNYFNEMCMQTSVDSENMCSLGIDRKKLKTLGNLKYAIEDTQISENKTKTIKKDTNHLLIICGSTHPGEEEILLDAFITLSSSGNKIHYLIAPRDIKRTAAIQKLSENRGLTTGLFSNTPDPLPQCLIIDTIGDLASLYSSSDIAFIGGTLINHGGHNPLEAACQKIPILFGPHMDNFSEISRDLLENNAAIEIHDSRTLTFELEKLIASESLRKEIGYNASLTLKKHTDVIQRHLTVIANYLC